MGPDLAGADRFSRRSAGFAAALRRTFALREELKSLPFGAVWDAHCLRQGVPVGFGWIDEIRAYERDVLSNR